MCAHVPRRPRSMESTQFLAGWQIADACMTLVQNMNGLEGGPTTAVSSRLVAHAYVRLHTTSHTQRVWRWGGGWVEGETCKPDSTNGCGHWVRYVWSFFFFLVSESCRAVRKPQSVNEQWGGQSDRQWSEISRWKPWGRLVGREIDPSKSTDSPCDIWCQTHENGTG